VRAVAVTPDSGWGGLSACLGSAGWAVVRARSADWAPGAAGGSGPERLARRSAASRRLVTWAAAVAVGVDRQSLQVARTPAGRPYVRGAEQLSVSVSHTGDLLVAGVSRMGPIGVDVELGTRAVHAGALAAEFCTEQERTDLSRLPDRERHAALIRLWTLKEAYSKAMGLGLRLPFWEFGFAPVTARAGRPTTLRHPDGTPATAEGWWFGTGALPQHAVLAVALSRAAAERAC
jgi:4'-phosphopantetheinyl transferase